MRSFPAFESASPIFLVSQVNSMVSPNSAVLTPFNDSTFKSGAITSIGILTKLLSSSVSIWFLLVSVTTKML